MTKVRTWINKMRKAVAKWVDVQPPASGIYIPPVRYAKCPNEDHLGVRCDRLHPHALRVIDTDSDFGGKFKIYRADMEPPRWTEESSTPVNLAPGDESNRVTIELADTYMAAITFTDTVQVSKRGCTHNRSQTLEHMERMLYSRLKYGINKDAIQGLRDIQALMQDCSFEPTGRDVMDIHRTLNETLDKLTR